MAQQLRLFELLCLTDLAGLISFDDKWKPLYVSWLKRENDEYIDFKIICLWVKKALKRRDFIDVNSVLYKNTEHFPKSVQTSIIYSIQNKCFGLSAL